MPIISGFPLDPSTLRQSFETDSKFMDIGSFIIFFSGILSGFVDAIAGGGGLIMIPALIVSGLPASTAIATNKLCGTAGTLSSSLKFASDKNVVNWDTCIYMGMPAVFGAVVGSRSISFLPKEWAEPIVLALLVAITLFVLLKPTFGMEVTQATPAIKQSRKGQILKLTIFGLIIGFHDGFFGPGTGTFIVFVLLSVWSLDFLQATGSAKIINFLTNLTALISFLWLGLIDIPRGLVGAIGVAIGAYGGAMLATHKGASIIKPIFVSVTLVLVGKLLFNYFSR